MFFHFVGNGGPFFESMGIDEILDDVVFLDEGRGTWRVHNLRSAIRF